MDFHASYESAAVNSVVNEEFRGWGTRTNGGTFVHWRNIKISFFPTLWQWRWKVFENQSTFEKLLQKFGKKVGNTKTMCLTGHRGGTPAGRKTAGFHPVNHGKS